MRPTPAENETESVPSEEALQYCGVEDCPWNNVTNPNLAKPESSTVCTGQSTPNQGDSMRQSAHHQRESTPSEEAQEIPLHGLL